MTLTRSGKYRSPQARWEDAHRLPPMRIKVPGTAIALLSRPTKMPGPSWSLPAGPACPFMRTGPNTICGSCFARGQGRYQQAIIQRAQWARFEWTRDCLRTPAGTEGWIATMVDAIASTGQVWMRVHDSGDLFSPAYTRAWTRVCAALPQVRFWFPTRSWQAPWVGVIRELAALPNVTVRPSALHFDEAPPRIEGLAAGTSASDVFSCPAPHQRNACGECRRCWTEPDTEVVYHRHLVRDRPLELERAA